MTFRPYSNYHKAIVKENLELAKNPKVIFLGQQVSSEDHYGTLKDIPMDRRIEMPVAEELQLSLSLGLSVEGFLPVSIYQRCDFLPRAMDAIVNHLNCFNKLSRGLYNPKIIFRTTVGLKKAGIQHSQDLTELLKVACNFPVFKVNDVQEVHWIYDFARKTDTSVMIIERQELFYD
jgi:pyruvate/2-oxoglutarate/acetoin dehydrogenase E1 component